MFCFLGEIVVATSGIEIKNQKIKIDKVCNNVTNICEEIVDRELKNINRNTVSTSGEKLFIEQGIKGIRGEVEAGLPSISQISYPQLVKAIKTDFPVISFHKLPKLL
ncbi:triphosphoribosyl-dephospho-CoA synthase [Anaerovirgula multivorans]|uniref:triphosphoribosyl-dephospho-CoA synthase n=1 Tax=Anaerovirgula multivorans TaxID=312168 RepID=UPI00113299EA